MPSKIRVLMWLDDPSVAVHYLWWKASRKTVLRQSTSTSVGFEAFVRARAWPPPRLALAPRIHTGRSVGRCTSPTPFYETMSMVQPFLPDWHPWIGDYSTTLKNPRLLDPLKTWHSDTPWGLLVSWYQYTEHLLRCLASNEPLWQPSKSNSLTKPFLHHAEESIVFFYWKILALDIIGEVF